MQPAVEHKDVGRDRVPLPAPPEVIEHHPGVAAIGSFRIVEVDAGPGAVVPLAIVGEPRCEVPRQGPVVIQRDAVADGEDALRPRAGLRTGGDPGAVGEAGAIDEAESGNVLQPEHGHAGGARAVHLAEMNVGDIVEDQGGAGVGRFGAKIDRVERDAAQVTEIKTVGGRAAEVERLRIAAL